MAKPDINPPLPPDENRSEDSDGRGADRGGNLSVSSRPATEASGEFIYRRVNEAPAPTPQPPPTIRARAREIAPTVLPLLIAFAVLLVLIFVLGYLSVRRMDDVSSAALDLEQQHAARLSLLLEVRLAVTKLNNEARARHEAESRRDLKPPFAFQLSTAREDVVRLLRELQRPPLTEEAEWIQFRNDLQSFVEVTQDLRRFSLEGHTRFEVVDGKLDALLANLSGEQDKIIAGSRAREEAAAQTIRRWTFLALLVGTLVAAAAIWEVQRWFGRMRSSMSEVTRERAFTTQLLEGMVSAVAAIDENDRIRSANAAFFQIFPGASVGSSVWEKLADEDAMKMLGSATATRVDTATYRGRWLCQIEDGPQKSFDVYSSPLAINGDRGQILTLVDVTEAAESERVLRRSESLAAVGRATTQVAHEIRNPLGSIRLGVSMLRDSVNNDVEALRTIELVERGIKHLNKLVVDVTQFSRQKALERADVDLQEMLERSLDLVSARIAEKHTPVEKQYPARHIMGHWDADQLRQVFVNLIANAIDASPERAPLRIVAERIEGGGENGDVRSYAKVSVIDRGSGMDRATLERVFEPFFSTKRRGTGLGLAIVKQIVEQHGGRINVQSEPGEGSTFTVELPL